MKPSRLTKVQIFEFLEQFGFDKPSLEMARRIGYMGNYQQRTKAELAPLVRHGQRLLQTGLKDDPLVDRYLSQVPLALATWRIENKGEWGGNAPLVDLCVEVWMPRRALIASGRRPPLFAVFSDQDDRYGPFELPAFPPSIRDLKNFSLEEEDYSRVSPHALPFWINRGVVSAQITNLRDQAEWLDARLFSMALRLPNNPHHTVIREDRP